MRTLNSSKQRWWLVWLLTAGFFIVAGTQVLLAASGTWSETTGDGAWSNGTFWVGGTVADGADSTANFSAIDVSATAVNGAFPGFFRNAVQLDSPRTIGNLTFGDSIPASPGGWQLYTNDTVANILTLAGATPTITVSPLGPIDTVPLGGTGTQAEVIDDAQVTNVTLAGTSGFTKTGAGILTLMAANPNLSGNINVNQGTLRLRSAASFDFDATVTPERANVNMANGTVLESEVSVGDIVATGAGISVAPGAAVTIRKIGTLTVDFTEVGGAGSTVNLESVGGGNTRLSQNWAAGGALHTVNMTGTVPGTPSVFQLRNNSPTGGFFNNSFVGTRVNLSNAVLTTNANSGGNLNMLGQLSGDSTSTLQGAIGGPVILYEIGAMNTDSTFAGAVTTSNGINISKVGTGKLTLSGNLTYTSNLNASADLRGGITRVIGGTLALSGTAAIPGGVVDATLGNLFTTIDVRSGGTLDVSGASTTDGTAALQQVIGSGTVVGPYNHSQGNLRPGDATFGETNLTTSAAGKLTFANSLNVSGGTINYDLAPPGVVGDYNSNNVVDTADYTLWRNNLGTNNPLLNRASGNTGAISPADYTAWKSNFGATAAGGGELIQVNGGALSGTTVVDVGVLSGAGSGTYTIINSTTPLTGSIAGWTVNWTGRGATPTLVQTANQVQLNAAALVPPATVNWRGDQSGVWDAGAAGTSNWHNTSTNAADKFFSRDTAQFLNTYDGATAPTTTTVTLNTTVNPGAVVVNSSLDYTISGTGRISGTASFLKQGTGRLTITTNNNFNGGTTISGGIVDLEGTGVLGSREITLAGGQLRAGVAGNFELRNDLVVNGTGNALSNDNAAAQTLNVRGRISGAGNLILANDGGGAVGVNGIDVFGDNTNFTGSITFANSGAPETQEPVVFRFRAANSQGTNVAWDVGNNGSTLSQRIDVATPTTFILGSLAGGTNSGVSGFGTGSNPGGASIWQIGSLNTNTDFAGVISNGNVGSNPAKTSAVTKVGTGTLTLSGLNTYSGDTRIEGGVLRTTNATALPDATAIRILDGASLNLNFDGTLGSDTIRGLIIPGATQAIGTWGSLASSATNKSAFLTGNGLLNVTAIIAAGAGSLDFSAVPEPTSAVLVLMALGLMASVRASRRA